MNAIDSFPLHHAVHKPHDGYVVHLVLREYADGSPAIELMTSDGERFAMLTAYRPDILLRPAQVLIKNYGENAGLMLDAIDAGLITRPVGEVKSGFAVLYLCLLIA